jgi:hypothetical protein
MIIRATIKLSAIDKKRFYTSAKTGEKYMSIVLMDSNYPSKFGDDGMVTEDVSKEERESGTKGTILGNWKYVVRPEAQKAPQSRQKAGSGIEQDDLPTGGFRSGKAATGDGGEDDVPF